MTIGAWVSVVTTRPEPLIMAPSDLSRDDSAKAVAMQRATQDGAPFDRADLPRQMVDLGGNAPRAPHVVFNGFLNLSPRAAAVLAAHDLGEGFLWPVDYVKKDRVTPASEGQWMGLHVGTRKDSFVPERSPAAEQSVPRPEIWLLKTLRLKAPEDLTLSSAALEGADIWRERRLPNSKIFLSARLVTALEAAGVAKDFYLHPCAVEGPTETARREAEARAAQSLPPGGGPAAEPDPRPDPPPGPARGWLDRLRGKRP